MARVSAASLFDDLVASKAPIFVRNNMSSSRALAGRPVGDLLVGLVDPDTHKSYTLAVPKNSTVCITDQVSHKTLSNSNEFRRYLSSGILQILDEAKYEELQETDPDHVEYSEEQNARLQNTLDGQPTQFMEDGVPEHSETARDLMVRPAVAGILMELAHENKSQNTIMQEIKDVGDLSVAEKQHLKDAVSSIPADRTKLRSVINKLK